MNKHHREVGKKKRKDMLPMLPTGIEPATSELEVQCHVHLATEACSEFLLLVVWVSKPSVRGSKKTLGATAALWSEILKTALFRNTTIALDIGNEFTRPLVGTSVFCLILSDLLAFSGYPDHSALSFLIKMPCGFRSVFVMASPTASSEGFFSTATMRFLS